MNAPPSWWRTYFAGLPGELWRAAMSPAQTRSEARGIASLLELAPGARVLDVPCGSGRLSLELARHGYSLVGIDIAEEGIAHARATAAEHGFDVGFVSGDMFELAWTNAFDAAICMGNSFGYGTDAESHAFLARLAAALVPGGQLLIDMPMLTACLQSRQELARDWHEIDSPDGPYWLLSEGRYDATRRRWYEHSVYLHGGRHEHMTMDQRVWDPDELVGLIAAAGFADVRLCADFRSREWQPDAATCQVVAHT